MEAQVESPSEETPPEAQFEALGHERFQRFCQSLLSYEKPDVQAFEVGNQDGGRDASAGNPREDGVEYVIFQVKQVRRPDPLDDPIKWIEKTLKGEMPRIEELIESGATSYQLMTNAIGTPHRHVGSVDKVAKHLREALPIPASCWWRNDLLIRLAKHHELRWGYPELLNAADILKELIEGSLSEDAQRRTRAIQTFVTSQHEAERKVRFKQVDLQNDLLNLFVDVPATLGRGQEGGHRRARLFVESIAQEDGIDTFPWEGPDVGAARTLLHPDVQEAMGKVVIEAAPGQGKSTLGQYISQVHRMRLLKKRSALRKVPERHRGCAARLPFKIDLRDFAVFLTGRDPFESSPEWGGLPDSWPRSLEGFLAATVRLFSGGVNFDVSDLLAVAEVSHLLLVLDGLDEVAEIEDRERVVEAVQSGCLRLEQLALGLQVVVTTRPVAFTNSPALDDESFLYLGLGSLTPELAAEYSSKWAIARGLDGADTSGVEQALMEQMDKPHISDLARNPMQLSILLALILKKGAGLPEKRTALYTGYMDVFFEREAAKDSIVREHGEILFALHSRLGWRLHAEAERTSAGGTISEEELKLEVERFLVRHRKDPSLVEQLFHGVVDRIFALVSPRLGGQFEFEIQPLREYFAADYLFSTAQVSRVGDERPGTLPDRFDGLARNSFWLNVTRFYAGFYDIGQLPSLAGRLEDLAKDKFFVATDRAWALAATFLGDWSFATDPESRDRAIDLALAGLGRRHLLTQRSSRHVSEEPLVLPKGSGLEELNERCWAVLEEGVPGDRQRAILGLLNALPETETLPQIRRRLADSEKGELTRWLQILSRLDATAAIGDEEMTAIADGDGQDVGARAAALLDAGFAGVVESDEEKSRAVVEGLIDGSLVCGARENSSSWLGLLGDVFADNGDLFRGPRTLGYRLEALQDLPARPLCPTAEQVKELMSVFFGGQAQAHYQLPWDDLVEECRSRWGDGWGLTRLGLIVIGRNGRPRSARRLDLADTSAPLLDRLRYAIMRGGVKGGDWWEEQLQAATEEDDRKVVLLTAIIWPSGAALEQVLPALEQGLKKLDGETLAELRWLVGDLAWNRGAAQPPKLEKAAIDSLSPLMTAMLANRDPKVTGAAAFSRLRSYSGNSEAVHWFRLETAISRLRKTRNPDRALLSVIRRTYKILGDFPFRPRTTYRLSRAESLPPELAEKIVADAGAYPLRLVDVAEAQCSNEARRFVPPLLKVAKEESWFPE